MSASTRLARISFSFFQSEGSSISAVIPPAMSRKRDSSFLDALS
jgi:hypothetical protein